MPSVGDIFAVPRACPSWCAAGRSGVPHQGCEGDEVSLRAPDGQVLLSASRFRGDGQGARPVLAVHPGAGCVELDAEGVEALRRNVAEFNSGLALLSE